MLKDSSQPSHRFHKRSEKNSPRGVFLRNFLAKHLVDNAVGLGLIG